VCVYIYIYIYIYVRVCVCVCVCVWKFLLQNFWAEMGHRQVAPLLKYTKKNCCTTCCSNSNEIPFLQLAVLYSRVPSVCI